MQDVDSRGLNKDPFVINNQVYILGKPIINAQTLDQLVYILDQLGESQPVVIINPEATTIPDFDQKLSNLIQNNRQMQPINVTTEDKYRFKDMSDAELEAYVRTECATSGQDYNITLYTYQGLRVRAQKLYALEQLCYERDDLWAAHCANPQSPEGSERYAQLTSELIPKAQAEYDLVVKQLQAWDEERVKQQKVAPKPVPPARVESETQLQQSSVNNTIHNTIEVTANVAAKPKSEPEVVDNGLQVANVDSDVEQAPWSPWLAPEYIKIPLSVAKSLAESAQYVNLRTQQRDVVFEGVTWRAVQPFYLLALGIDLVNDGIPVCYTPYGTFCRVGKTNVPANNLRYWRPEPTKL